MCFVSKNRHKEQIIPEGMPESLTHDAEYIFSDVSALSAIPWP